MFNGLVKLKRLALLFIGGDARRHHRQTPVAERFRPLRDLQRLRILDPRADHAHERGEDIRKGERQPQTGDGFAFGEKRISCGAALLRVLQQSSPIKSDSRFPSGMPTISETIRCICGSESEDGSISLPSAFRKETGCRILSGCSAEEREAGRHRS